MKRSVLVVLSFALTSLVPSLGHATHSVVGSYAAPTTPGVSITCSPDCAGEPGLNIGGYTFAAEGEIPSKLTIADELGGAVAVVIGQDLDGDDFSGEAGEPRVDACATQVSLSSSTVPFRADKDTVVFIKVFDPTNNACAGVASSGTITLTF